MTRASTDLDTCDHCGKPTEDLHLIQEFGHDFVCSNCERILYERETRTGASVMARARAERDGFLTESDVAVIAKDPATRLQLLLVRCGCGRFLAPAQDVKHLIDIIERDYQATPPGVGDYIRDVALPATQVRA